MKGGIKRKMEKLKELPQLYDFLDNIMENRYNKDEKQWLYDFVTFGGSISW